MSTDPPLGTGIDPWDRKYIYTENIQGWSREEAGSGEEGVAPQWLLLGPFSKCHCEGNCTEDQNWVQKVINVWQPFMCKGYIVQQNRYIPTLLKATIQR